MAQDFMAVTEALFSRLTAKDLAEELKCGLSSVKQARMTSDKGGIRPPPDGWEAAVARLARKRAAQFQKLADRLS